MTSRIARQALPAADYARAVQRVLWYVLALNLLIAFVKLGVGLVTGSVSVAADALHSLVDSSSNVVGLIGIAVAARPPDLDHPYGHRKFETVAALAIGGLLLLAGYEIVRAAFERVASGAAADVTPLMVVIMAATVPVNVAITLYESRRGRALGSQVLLADAAHTRTDILVTTSVVAGLIAAAFGLGWMDMVVALGVSVVIVRAAVRILREALVVLSDSIAIAASDVERVARSVPGVWFAHRVRSRGQAGAIYVDLHVKVDPAMSTDQAHAIASEVERKLMAELFGVVDAVVHVEPGEVQLARPDAFERVLVRLRAIADGLGLGVHNVYVYEVPEGYGVALDVEVPGSLSLAQAHALASHLEQRALAEVPGLATIVTHIEPRPETVAAVPDDDRGTPPALAALARRLEDIGDEVCGPGASHSAEVTFAGGHYTASLHCTHPGYVALVDAHMVAEEVERRIRAGIPELGHITVHIEPPEG
jgi:cation diffusion facilitator family transporter